MKPGFTYIANSLISAESLSELELIFLPISINGNSIITEAQVKNLGMKLDMVVHAFNLKIREAETGGS
jgi:hypothetical protein